MNLVGVVQEKNIKNVIIRINMKSDNLKALISVIFAAIFGGGIAVFSKIGLKQIPPISFTFLRFLIASLCMLPLILKEKIKVDKNIIKIILLSLLASANVVLFAFGIRLTTATISQMLYAVVPVIAGILSYFLLKEKIVSKKILGIFLGLLGVLTLILLPVFENTSNFHGSLIGNLIIMLAVFGFSIYTVLSKKLHKYYSPIFLTFVFAVTTTVILSPFFIKDIINSQWIYNLRLISILSTLYVGIFGGAVYYILYQYAIKHSTPVIASMTMYLQPIATFFWAFFLLSERLTPGIIIGSTLSIGGAWLVTRV